MLVREASASRSTETAAHADVGRADEVEGGARGGVVLLTRSCNQRNSSQEVYGCCVRCRLDISCDIRHNKRCSAGTSILARCEGARGPGVRGDVRGELPLAKSTGLQEPQVGSPSGFLKVGVPRWSVLKTRWRTRRMQTEGFVARHSVSSETSESLWKVKCVDNEKFGRGTF